MSMKYPDMSVKEYLTLLKDAKVAASKAYALSNQDVRKGRVYFLSNEKMDLLRQLLVASESGTAPAQEYYLQKKREEDFSKALGSIDFESLKTRIKNLTGPMDKVGIEDNVLIVPSRRLERLDTQRIHCL